MGSAWGVGKLSRGMTCFCGYMWVSVRLSSFPADIPVIDEKNKVKRAVNLDHYQNLAETELHRIQAYQYLL